VTFAAAWLLRPYDAPGALAVRQQASIQHVGIQGELWSEQKDDWAELQEPASPQPGDAIRRNRLGPARVVLGVFTSGGGVELIIDESRSRPARSSARPGCVSFAGYLPRIDNTFVTVDLTPAP
jgi:hypothetical protein